MDNLLLTIEPFLTGKPLEVWLNNVGIEDWSIDGNGLVEVLGDVDLGEKLGGLKRLPVRFGKVVGDFYCRDTQLVSLEGAPVLVGENFRCDRNQLVSLEGAPKKVGGSFDCANNQLVGLYGSPKEVGGDFYCHNNLLVSLEGTPKEVRDFYCSFNPLVSLEGVPERIGGDLWCSHNLLVDFKGMENVTIGGKLIVTQPDGNKGARKNNVIVSLDGLPKELYGSVKCLDVKALLALEAKHSSVLDIEI